MRVSRLVNRRLSLLAPQRVRTVVNPADETPLLATTRIEALEEALELLSGYIQLRGRVLLLQDVHPKDLLFAGNYLNGLIHDPESSLSDRTEAFMNLAYLDGGEAFLLDCAGIWIGDALMAEAEQDKVQLLIGASQMGPDPLVRTLIVEFARYDTADRVRERAIAALSEYSDEEAWSVIEDALRDPALSVRREAQESLSRRR